MSMTKKRSRCLLLFLTLLCIWAAVAAGCGAASNKQAGGDFSAPPRGAEGESWNIDPQYSEADGEQSKEAVLSQAKSRFLIRQGSLTLTVSDARKAAEQVEQMAEAAGGIVSESNVYEFREGHHSAELTLRIPETRFDNFMVRLQELGEASNVRKSSEDVTLPYLDLETRVENLKAEEERLREILEKTHTVEEILQVERELSRVRSEIELKTMTFTHLQDQVALSTIELYIGEEVIGSQTISQKPFANMGKRLKDAFFRSINFLSSAAAFILVALTTLLPALIIIALFLLIIFRLLRAIRNRRKGVPPGGQPPATTQ